MLENAPRTKRMCCACPQTKNGRDECIVMKGKEGKSLTSLQHPFLKFWIKEGEGGVVLNKVLNKNEDVLCLFVFFVFFSFLFLWRRVACKPCIEAYKICLRSEGFDV